MNFYYPWETLCFLFSCLNRHVRNVFLRRIEILRNKNSFLSASIAHSKSWRTRSHKKNIRVKEKDGKGKERNPFYVNIIIIKEEKYFMSIYSSGWKNTISHSVHNVCAICCFATKRKSILKKRDKFLFFFLCLNIEWRGVTKNDLRHSSNKLKSSDAGKGVVHKWRLFRNRIFEHY